jgi:hypothetical protein
VLPRTNQSHPYKTSAIYIPERAFARAENLLKFSAAGDFY